MLKIFSFDSLERSGRSHRRTLTKDESASRLQRRQVVSSQCSPCKRSCQKKELPEVIVSSLFKGVYFSQGAPAVSFSGFVKEFNKLNNSILKVLYVGKGDKQATTTPNNEIPQILEHIQRLFPERTISQLDIWVCCEEVSQNRIVYFSKSFCQEETTELLPFSKCCHSPIRVVFSEPGRAECLKCRKCMGEFALVPHRDYTKLQAQEAFTLMEQKRKDVCAEISNVINSMKKTSIRKLFNKTQPARVMRADRGTMLVKIYPPVATARTKHHTQS